MPKYHINPHTDQPNVCHAKKRCPFGDLETEHYSSKEDASRAVEKQYQELHQFERKVYDELDPHQIDINLNERWTHLHFVLRGTHARRPLTDYRGEIASFGVDEVRRRGAVGPVQLTTLEEGQDSGAKDANGHSIRGGDTVDIMRQGQFFAQPGRVTGVGSNGAIKLKHSHLGMPADWPHNLHVRVAS